MKLSDYYHERTRKKSSQKITFGHLKKKTSYHLFTYFLVRLHRRLRHQAHHHHRALPDHQLTVAEEEIEVGIDEDLLSEGNLH